MSGCQCDGSMHSPFVHFWQRMTARALSVEFIYFHGDDVLETRREIELSVPDWAWRPCCWLRGHSSDTYGACVICRLPEKRSR